MDSYFIYTSSTYRNGNVPHDYTLAHKEFAIHIALWDRITPYFEVYYNNLNMSWSLSKHEHDFENKKVYKNEANPYDSYDIASSNYNVTLYGDVFLGWVIVIELI